MSSNLQHYIPTIYVKYTLSYYTIILINNLILNNINIEIHNNNNEVDSSIQQVMQTKFMRAQSDQINRTFCIRVEESEAPSGADERSAVTPGDTWPDTIGTCDSHEPRSGQIRSQRHAWGHQTVEGKHSAHLVLVPAAHLLLLIYPGSNKLRRRSWL